MNWTLVIVGLANLALGWFAGNGHGYGRGYFDRGDSMAQVQCKHCLTGYMTEAFQSCPNCGQTQRTPMLGVQPDQVPLPTAHVPPPPTQPQIDQNLLAGLLQALNNRPVAPTPPLAPQPEQPDIQTVLDLITDLHTDRTATIEDTGSGPFDPALVQVTRTMLRKGYTVTLARPKGATAITVTVAAPAAPISPVPTKARPAPEPVYEAVAHIRG